MMNYPGFYACLINRTNMPRNIINNKTDRLFGQTGTFTGYSMVVFGLIALYYKLYPTFIALLIAGSFIAFTYTGTKIDLKNRKIKSYTCLFGFIILGKWISVNEFTRFTIYKSKRSYTTYSRANVPLTLKEQDIRLALVNSDGTQKIIINKYNSFEAARDAMTSLASELGVPNYCNWEN